MLKQHQIEQLLLPKLESLEEERLVTYRKMSRNSSQATIAIILFVLCLVTGFTMDYTIIEDQTLASWIYSFVAVLFFVAVGSYVYAQNENKKMRRAFQQRVKSSIYKEVFKAWNPTTRYEPNKKMPQDEFKKADLYPNFNRYQGDDHCVGTLEDGRRFRFSELNVQREERVTKDSTRLVPVFKGLFFVLDNTIPAQGFDGRLKIEPKERVTQKQKKRKKAKPKAARQYNDNILDADLALPQPTKQTKEIEVPLFDQLHTVTPNNFSTRAQLSNEFCDAIAQLRVQDRQNVALSFVNNKAYLACKHNLDFWPVHIELPMLSKARVRHVAWSFWVAFNVLDALAKHTHLNRTKAG